MPQRIDREVVFQMAKTGFPKYLIAERLECSTKQVGRIVKEIETDKNIKLTKNINLKDPEVEKACRAYYMKMESPEKVANRFGITKQALLK